MGEFIFKFFKELNSATSSKTIVLAIILGLIAGFLPSVNFFSFVIFFIVFVFRIPIGLFIASFGFFKIIGAFLDPLFNKIGYWLLTNKILDNFWVFLYNLPFFRWSGFNNTLVLGSLVVGIGVGIILYIVLIKIIKIYRKAVFDKLKEIKYFKWLVPTEEKGIIRISGILFLLGIGLLISVFAIFLLDPIIKSMLEVSLSKVTHKKVAIKKVNVSLKNLSVNIKDMQIGDILFSKVYTKFDFDKLVWRKYKIDDLKILAQTDKNIYDLIKKSNLLISTTKPNVNNKSNLKTNYLSLPKPSQFLAKQKLYSEEALNKLKRDYEKVRKDLEKFNLKRYENKFNALKEEINSLNNIKINSPSDFEVVLKKVKSIKAQTNRLVKEIKENKKLLVSDKKLIENDLKNLKIALDKDKANIKSKYEMIKNKEYLKFSESILKPKIAEYLNLILSIYKKVEPYLNSDNEKEVIRLKGKYIKFEDKIKYPDFVLVNFQINLKTSIANWNLKIKNLSDNQLLLSKKGSIDLIGKSKFFDVGGKINYLREVEFLFYGNRIKINKLNLNFFILKSFLDAKVIGKLYKDNIDATINLYFYNPSFEGNVKILKNLNIKHFKVKIKILGNIKSPIIKVSSDLDRYISKIVENKINSLIQKHYKKTQALLDNRVNAVLKSLKLKEIDIKLNKLSKLENVNNLINNNLNKIISSKKNEIMKDSIQKFFKF